MSSQDPSGDYCPRIESVIDSLGHTAAEELREVKAQNHVNTHATLRPGDVVTFTCRGTDPQGRPLIWWLHTEHNPELHHVKLSGEEVVLQWDVSDGDVADSTWVCIRMNAEGTPYHRTRQSDMAVVFTYRVVPPAP